MKTTRSASVLILSVGIFLLWATPILASNEFDAGWFAIEFCVLMGTYVMLVYPSLFSFIPRRNKQTTYSAMA